MVRLLTVDDDAHDDDDDDDDDDGGDFLVRLLTVLFDMSTPPTTH